MSRDLWITLSYRGCDRGISMKVNRENAVKTIKNGGIVALKSETVYGLAGDATNEKAVDKIFKAKGRKRSNPLIVHVSSIKMAQKYAVMNPLAIKLAKEFWPGPLTMILPIIPSTLLARNVNQGQKFIGLRMPVGIIREIAREIDSPIAAPSANITNRISPSDAEIIEQQFKNKIKIVDQGKCKKGIESTIVKVGQENVQLVRPGALDWKYIERSISKKIRNAKNVKAPGQSKLHYAPTKIIRINVVKPKNDEGFICFGKQKNIIDNVSINISKKGDYIEAAKNLFYSINKMDRNINVKKIAVQKISEVGKNKNIAVAINNRLKKMCK